MKDLLRLLFIFIVIILVFEASTAHAQLPDVCQAPENILPNCNFDNGLDKWQKFIEAGGADFSVLYGGGECHAPLCPAAYIVTDDHFVGGLYQQVPVTPGNTYYANIIWLVFDSLANDAAVNEVVGGIGRRIGIDPFGGADPRSPNIIWSEDNWRNDCKICGVEEVTATAQADAITVFLRLDDTWRLRAAEKGFAIPSGKDQFWIDDIGLKQVGEGQTVDSVVAAEPTEAPPPPTNTPPSPLPTDTPEPETSTEAFTPVKPSTEVAQAELTSADLASEAETEPISSDETGASVEKEQVAASVEASPPTNTIAPPPTLTPTHTPQPTAMPVAQSRAAAISTRAARPAAPQPVASPAASEASIVASMPSIQLVGLVGTTACIGGVFVVIMVVVLGALTWLYRLGWGNIDDEMDNNGDIETIEVDIIE